MRAHGVDELVDWLLEGVKCVSEAVSNTEKIRDDREKHLILRPQTTTLNE